MRTDRDSIVTKGEQAHARSLSSHNQKGPWLYRAKVKSGTRSTRNIEGTFTSVPHLVGSAVVMHARDNETFNVYAITRVMKSHLRSQREDI